MLLPQTEDILPHLVYTLPGLDPTYIRIAYIFQIIALCSTYLILLIQFDAATQKIRPTKTSEFGNFEVPLGWNE